jgi:hypothetical protein
LKKKEEFLGGKGRRYPTDVECYFDILLTEPLFGIFIFIAIFENMKVWEERVRRAAAEFIYDGELRERTRRGCSIFDQRWQQSMEGYR